MDLQMTYLALVVFETSSRKITDEEIGQSSGQ